MNVGCFVFAVGPLHERLAYCATRSFEKWHPDIPLFTVEDVVDIDKIAHIPKGIMKFMAASQVAREKSLDKIIVLGADTITCSRLDEFLDDNDTDILTSLDYPYPLHTPCYNGEEIEDRIPFYCEYNVKWSAVMTKAPHVNADVVCFNNMDALDLFIVSSPHHGNYFEQGALNEVCYKDPKFSSRPVDFPYEDSEVVYNARAKGNICAAAGTKPWYPFTSKYHTKNDKLFTKGIGPADIFSKGLDKQIKVFHYCDGFGTLDQNGQIGLMNDWFSKGFNKDTKKFFKEHCNCGDFFDGEFTL